MQQQDHKLRVARRKRGITLAQVAKHVGCGKAYLSRIENGIAYPSHRLIARICEALPELQPNDFFSDRNTTAATQQEPAHE